MTETTNDQLAVMIKEGFDAVDKRFRSVEGRLDSIERRLHTIETRLDRIEGNVADLRSNQGELIDVLQGKDIITKAQGGKLRSRIFGRAA